MPHPRRGVALVEALVAVVLAALVALPALDLARRAVADADRATRTRRLARTVDGALAQHLAEGCAAAPVTHVAHWHDADVTIARARDAARVVVTAHVVPRRGAPQLHRRSRPCD
ncbi:MAG: hypothetical protein MUF21_00830 [Gemmatimonadaceae bacterium]|jgi:type II secretory pathway pseudopilin PulG|nr:hypothetical protein [Gemmatimonadaceae bacterium]